MQEVPNQINKYTCEKGEVVTFTFDENETTVFLVTNAFITPVNPARVDETTKTLVFKVLEDTVLVVTYVFSNEAGGLYEVGAHGSKGGNFTSQVSQPIGRKVSNHIYTFGVSA